MNVFSGFINFPKKKTRQLRRIRAQCGSAQYLCIWQKRIAENYQKYRKKKFLPPSSSSIASVNNAFGMFQAASIIYPANFCVKYRVEFV